MAVAQSLLDAQARQDAAIAAISAKVDTLLANQPDPNAMSVAEQDALAADLNAKAVTLEATAQR